MITDHEGVCVECGEWTSTDDPCCSDGVWSEGHVYTDIDSNDDESTEGN